MNKEIVYSGNNELSQPKNEIIVVEVAAAPSEHRFCSLLQG